MRNKPRLFAYTLSLLVLAQMLVIVLSWMLNAFFPQAGVHSLLSNWGVRWYFGHYVDNIRIPFLVWAIMLSAALGAYSYSGLHHALKAMLTRRPLKDKQPLALRITASLVLVELAVVFFLALKPNALLRNVTGSLFPSSFSECLIPILTFVMMSASLCFAIVSRKLNSAEKFYHLHVCGIMNIAWFFPLYILAAQLYASTLWVFGFSW